MIGNLVNLSFTVGIGFDRLGDAIPANAAEQVLADVQRQAAAEHGGYSLVRLWGGWINPDGLLVQEPAIRLTVSVNIKEAGLNEPPWVDPAVGNLRSFAWAYAQRLGLAFAQYSVMIDWPDGSAELHDTSYAHYLDRPQPA